MSRPIISGTVIGIALFACFSAGCSGGGADGGAGTGGVSNGASGGASSGTSGGSTGGSSGVSSSSSSTGTGPSGGTSGGSAPGMGALCSPATIDAVCAPAGYVCDRPSGTCQLPSAFEPCDVTVGCAVGLTCTLGLGEDGGSLCAQNCAATADCLDPTTICASVSSTKVCLLNSCGPDTATGSNAYLACNAAANDDGICYPSNGPTGMLCQQGAAVADSQPCGFTRNSPLGLCQVGSVCVPFNSDTTLSACLQLCPTAAPAFPDGGPGCPTNFTCAGASGPEGVYGVCIQNCVQTSDCLSPLTCQDFGAATKYCAPYAPPDVLDAGRDLDGGLLVDGLQRSYYLHVPFNIPDAGIPLIFGLHGSGDNGYNFCNATLVSLSDEKGIIVVCPDAVDANWFVDNSVQSLEADVDFVLQLLQTIEGTYPIDAKRVYAAGFSRGATFTGALATTSGQTASVLLGYQYESPFAAFGLSAGLDWYNGYLDFKLSIPKRPIWLIHGTSDGTNPFSRGESFAFALQDAGWPAIFTPVPGANHDWLWQSQYGWTDDDLWDFFKFNAAP